jgi:allantoinase
MSNFALKSKRILLGDGTEPRPGMVLVKGEKVSQICDYDHSPSGRVLDVGNQVVMPGVVDTHAHINEPGRTDWEGFQTATRSAAAGGITTVIDMPLNSIPATTTVEALRIKAETARGKCSIDYGFWGGVIPGNSDQLEDMIERGALGFKAFLCDSGVKEFPMSTEADLRKAMPILARARVPLLVHAELETGTHAVAGRSYQSFLESRPKEWEVQAVRMMVALAREFKCRVHIVHLSASDALKDLGEAKAQGVLITAETCPHYLHFEAETIPEGATQFKCAPPIREHENRERLWQGLKDDQISFVVSDHSPCTPGLKHLNSGDFSKAWGGISGLQFSLPVVWSEMKLRNLGLPSLTRWMSGNTARFAGLSDRKGLIAPGFDADLVVWDPERSFRVTRAMVLHRNKITPYEGTELFGTVHQTFVRGSCIYENGEFSHATLGHQVFRGVNSK